MNDAHADLDSKNSKVKQSGQPFTSLQQILPQTGQAMNSTTVQINAVERSQFVVHNDRLHDEQTNDNAQVGGGLDLNLANL